MPSGGACTCLAVYVRAKCAQEGELHHKTTYNAGPASPHNLLEVLCAVSTGVDASEAVDQLPRVPLLLARGVVRKLCCQRVQESPGSSPQLLLGDWL